MAEHKLLSDEVRAVVRLSVTGALAARAYQAGETTAKPEVIWSRPRNQLMNWLDMGPTGLMSKRHVFCVLGVRGWFMFDPSHRRWDNVKLSFTHAGASHIKAELIIANNIQSGPYDGAAFHGEMKEASGQFFASMSIASGIWVLFYPRIAWHFHRGQLPSSYGGVGHQQWLFDLGHEAMFGKGKGWKAKLNRWFQLVARGRRTLHLWGFFEMILTWIGLQNKWYGSLEESPFHLGCNSVATVAGPAEGGEERTVRQGQPGGGRPGSSGAAPPRGVMTSNEAVDREINKPKVAPLHLANQVFSNQGTRAVAVGVCEVVLPIELEAAETIICHKTQRGCSEWHVQVAARERPGIQETLEKFCTDEVLLDSGLQVWGGRPGQVRDEIRRDKEAILETLREFTMIHVTKDVEFRELYRVPPFRFAGVLGDSDDVEETMQWAKKMWGALAELERKGLYDPFFKDFARDLLWPANPWVRELFISASEMDWEDLAEPQRDEIRHVVSGWGGTKDIEDLFNLLRKFNRSSPGGSFDVRSQWFRCIHGPVLPESDKPKIQVGQEDRVGRGESTIPKKKFGFVGHRFTLGQEACDSILETTTTFSPDFYLSLPVANQALLDAHEAGDLEILKGISRSRWVKPGWVVVRTNLNDPDEYFYVMSSNQFGANLYRASTFQEWKDEQEEDLERIITLSRTGTRDDRTIVSIDVPEEWEVVETIPVDPHLQVAPAPGAEPALPAGVAWHWKWRDLENRMSVFEAGCSEAWTWLTVEQMKAVLRYQRGPEDERTIPSRGQDVLLECCRETFPEFRMGEP
jgi:hypothetical protein